MDDSAPKALSHPLRERLAAGGFAARPGGLDREDFRIFAFTFVAGFLFFLFWLG